MLSQVAHLADGTRVEVDGAAVDTVRALKHGDGILGWEGDENMEVLVDLSTGMFDVWTLDAHAEPMLVLSRPYCDHRLVADVLRADTRRRDVAGDIIAHNIAVDEARKADFDARTEEAAEKLQWALRRDLGAYEGGLTRSFTYFPEAV